MATNYDKSVNTAAKAKNAMERLAQVENAVQGLLKLVDRELGSVVNQLNQLSDVLNAAVKVAGLEAVQKVLVDTAQEKLASEEAAIAEGQLEGKLNPVEVVPPQGIVGYKEFDAQGQLRIPGKYFKNIGQLGADAQNLLVGKTIGFTTDIGNGAKMEVVEAYEFVQQPAIPFSGPVQAADVNGQPADAVQLEVAPENVAVEAAPAVEVAADAPTTTPEA